MFGNLIQKTKLIYSCCLTNAGDATDKISVPVEETEKVVMQPSQVRMGFLTVENVYTNVNQKGK